MKNKNKRYVRTSETNRNARIEERGTGVHREIFTAMRDPETMTARVDVRERTDVASGRSLTGLSIKTAGGRSVRLTGHEARTLYRILERANNIV